jgi:hypothetical protein
MGQSASDSAFRTSGLFLFFAFRGDFDLNGDVFAGSTSKADGQILSG